APRDRSSLAHRLLADRPESRPGDNKWPGIRHSAAGVGLQSGDLLAAAERFANFDGELSLVRIDDEFSGSHASNFPLELTNLKLVPRPELERLASRADVDPCLQGSLFLSLDRGVEEGPLGVVELRRLVRLSRLSRSPIDD